MATQIQWRRVAGGTAIPHFREEGQVRWRPYTESPLKVPDTGAYSRGYLTWLRWIKAGYTPITEVGNE